MISRSSESSVGSGFCKCVEFHAELCIHSHPTYLWEPSGHRQLLSIQDGRFHSCILRNCQCSGMSCWRSAWASPLGHLCHHVGTGGRGVGSQLSPLHTCLFPMRNHSGQSQAQTVGTGLGNTRHFSKPRWWHTVLGIEPRPAGKKAGPRRYSPERGVWELSFLLEARMQYRLWFSALCVEPEAHR